MLLQYQRLILLLILGSTLKLVSKSENISIQTNHHDVGVMPTNVSMLMTNGSNSKSSSAVSLLSAEAEQALLKVNSNYCNCKYNYCYSK